MNTGISFSQLSQRYIFCRSHCAGALYPRKGIQVGAAYRRPGVNLLRYWKGRRKLSSVMSSVLVWI